MQLKKSTRTDQTRTRQIFKKYYKDIKKKRFHFREIRRRFYRRSLNFRIVLESVSLMYKSFSTSSCVQQIDNQNDIENYIKDQILPFSTLNSIPTDSSDISNLPKAYAQSTKKLTVSNTYRYRKYRRLEINIYILFRCDC